MGGRRDSDAGTQEVRIRGRRNDRDYSRAGLGGSMRG
jgi:hypothetical protein